MTSTMEECVLDFDIDLFQQLPKCDLEKMQKSLTVIKGKVTSTNGLLKKYYNKGIICKSLENYLLDTKEAYKQVCIERMEFREKCAALEEEIKKCHEANKVLQEKCIASDNQYDGIQSHSKQLTLLIKENETTIESLKIENELEKSTSKDFEKKCATLQKENDHLIKNICILRDIILGKKTATKEIKSFLNKYGKSDTNVCQEVNSSDEVDAFDDCLSPLLDPRTYNHVPSPPGAKISVKVQSTKINEANNGDDDHDSESSNEIVSSDTGRGSSLAFSDSDKFSLLSPEYYINHSPGSAELIRSKDKMVVTIGTSPILRREFTSVATSPIMFKDQNCSEEMDSEDSDSTITNSPHTHKKSNRRVPIIMIDRVVSPICTIQYVDMSTSTDRNISCDVGTSPLRLDRTSDCNYNSNQDDNNQEKECLDINNSNNLVDENSSDGEIQMILDTMRFHQKLITPIPTTPAKSRTEMATNISTQTSLHVNAVCPDVAKIREENVALQATVAKLAQEVMNINNFLNKCSSSMINETTINTESQKQLNSQVLMEVKDGMKTRDGHLEPKTTGHQDNDVFVNPSIVTKNPLSFKGRISKLKELFDDSSPPSPSDALILQPPIMELCESPPPSPLLSAPQSLPPPSSPVAPRPVSPALSVASADIIILNDNVTETSNSFKSKQRLDFEDPISRVESDVALSDQEMTYEHEIVVELTPDSQESDTISLHEILKEQQANLEKTLSKDKPKTKKITKLEKLRKNMAPKSKITKAKTGRNPTGKLRVQPKRLTANKERILDSDCAVDCRAAYEKARKVMAEIKSKEKANSSANVDLDQMSNTCKKKSRELLKSAKTVIEKEIGKNRRNHSIIHDSLEKLPLKRAENVSTIEDCSVDTCIDSQSAAEENQNKDTQRLGRKVIKAAECAFKDKDLSPAGYKRSVKTRNQSKSIDANNEYNTEMLHFNTNHLTSPSLKRYGRNSIAKNSEIQHINNNTLNYSFSESDSQVVTTEEETNTETVQLETRKRLKRPSIDKPVLVSKRILRSSSVQQPQIDEDKNEPAPNTIDMENTQNATQSTKAIVAYDDLDLFDNNEVDMQSPPEPVLPNINPYSARRPANLKLGILCTFLDKYGSKNIKRAPKISENIIDAICKELEDNITEIQKLSPKDAKQAMDKLVRDLQSRTPTHLLSAVMKYLKEPARKIESYNKINVPPAPPMTKVEQILVYIVAQLKVVWPEYNIVDNLLKYIEYTLFMLNRTPEFDVIETLSHFYAILCRYDKNRNRLRLFIIDAMYCLQYKAVPLIRQCLDVWMHILPLAHLGIAKNPLVTCLVYLLHFYKCEDKFNRVQDIRNILRRKYFYEVSEWNETGILEMFRNSILEIRDIPSEKKMVRMALIILAKRNGARWCQNHIVKNMLLPIIEKAEVPDRIKHFCVALLGPLLKPYPMDMKVNCEVIMNQLFDMLKRNPTIQMEEAIFTSLIYMSRHNQYRVIKALLNWTPKSVSPEFEELLINYVKERPVRSWKQVLTKMFVHK